MRLAVEMALLLALASSTMALDSCSVLGTLNNVSYYGAQAGGTCASVPAGATCASYFSDRPKGAAIAFVNDGNVNAIAHLRIVNGSLNAGVRGFGATPGSQVAWSVRDGTLGNVGGQYWDLSKSVVSPFLALGYPSTATATGAFSMDSSVPAMYAYSLFSSNAVVGRLFPLLFQSTPTTPHRAAIGNEDVAMVSVGKYDLAEYYGMQHHSVEVDGLLAVKANPGASSGVHIRGVLNGLGSLGAVILRFHTGRQCSIHGGNAAILPELGLSLEVATNGQGSAFVDGVMPHLNMSDIYGYQLVVHAGAEVGGGRIGCGVVGSDDDAEMSAQLGVYPNYAATTTTSQSVSGAVSVTAGLENYAFTVHAHGLDHGHLYTRFACGLVYHAMPTLVWVATTLRALQTTRGSRRWGTTRRRTRREACQCPSPLTGQLPVCWSAELWDS